MSSVSNIIAFDFGTRNIGVAIGQRVTCTARPLKAFKAINGVPDWKQIEKLFNEWMPSTAVVGLPLNMNGSEQQLTAYARKFANRLHDRFNDIQVLLHDERLSTIEARSELFLHGGYRALKKFRVDANSAVIILESWLQQFSKKSIAQPVRPNQKFP
ncbi:MAG: Holliday junction resolvase RuvX [Sodalis sp. (in: enterobacteria)]